MTLAGLIAIVEQGTISSTVAKEYSRRCGPVARPPSVAAEGLAQISDSSRSRPIVRRVIDAHGDIVAEIRAGKDRKFQFLVGQVMKETKGEAIPNSSPT